jgi:DNA anti-recombination protein RmuC
MLVSLSEGSERRMSEDLTKKLPISDGGAILTAIKKIDDRLQRLEQRVEERLHDTRPMWNRVADDILQLQGSVERLETGVERLEKGQGELRDHMREVNRDQIVINDVVRKIQLDFHTIDERLHRLEVNRR